MSRWYTIAGRSTAKGHFCASDQTIALGPIWVRKSATGRRCLRLILATFTSLPCAPGTGGENPHIDTQDGFKASDCGRLGRQGAGHPWSALRVVKSCRKDCPTASVLPKPKQQLCIQSGTRAHYLNHLHRRWTRREKEAQAIGLAIR